MKQLYHYHHHVHEGLGVFPAPWSSRWNWSLHLFLGRPTFLPPFGLYCSAWLGILFVSILCMCCSHFSWYYFYLLYYILCSCFFPLIHWFFSLSSFVIPSKCLKNFICAASKRCSSLFFSTQASLPKVAISNHKILRAAVIEMTEQNLIPRQLQVSVHHIVMNALRSLWIKNPSDLGTSRIGNPGVIEGFDMVFIFRGFIERPYAANRGHPDILMPWKGFSVRQRKIE